MIKKNAGFSLVELIVALGILSVIVLIVTNIYINQSQTFYQESELDILQGEISVFQNSVTNDVHSAIVVVGEINLDGQNYSSSENQIVLKLPALGENYQTRYDNNEIIYFDYIIYTLDKDARKLISKNFIDSYSLRKQKDQTFSLNLDQASQFNFLPENRASWDDVKGIDVFIKLSKNVSNENISAEFANLIQLRNN